MHPAQAMCLACAVKNLAPRLEKNCYHSLVSFPMRRAYMYFCSSRLTLPRWGGYNIRTLAVVVCT